MWKLTSPLVFLFRDQQYAVLLTPQTACPVPQRGASMQHIWDSSGAAAPSSPSGRGRAQLTQPLAQQQLDTCCSCILVWVLWSLLTLTWFSRNSSPFPFSFSLTLSYREMPSQFHSSFRPATLGVPIACFLMEVCTSLEHRCGYFSCHS